MAETFKIKRKVKKWVEVEEEVEMSFNEFIGYKLRLARKQRKILQEEAAKFLKMSRPSLVNIEAGRVNVSVERLRDMCAYYECSSQDIIDF